MPRSVTVVAVFMIGLTGCIFAGPPHEVASPDGKLKFFADAGGGRATVAVA